MSKQPASVATLDSPDATAPVVVVPDGWDPTQVQGLIVVGVIASGGSHEAIGYAFRAAATRGGELILLYVLEGAPTRPDQPWYPAARQLVTRALDGWPDKFPDVTFRTHYRLGDPADVLARYSQVADLVVVGGASSTPLGKSLQELSKCPIAFTGGH
ncbi:MULTISPECIES: universal stress protein [unclassified Kribbella]|uniref:universal stress protein n=1 Tax=unclassified Kribbella TaxID=2644121 RepID=UPI003015BA23